MQGFRMALTNLSRIHLGNYHFEEKTFGSSTKYFSLVGLLLGLLLYCLYDVTQRAFPPLVVAALLILGELVLTGGLHLDGFMDSMDGLFSGRGKERKLEIMKDSRVGANGVMTVVTLLLVKFTLLIQLPMDYLVALPLMMASARWLQVFCIYTFPYARKEGMGSLYKQYTGVTELMINTAILLVSVAVTGQFQLYLVCLVLLGLTFVMGRQICQTIGGLTGDTYGAMTELSEVIFLLLLYLI